MTQVEFENMIHIHGPDILRFCRMTCGSVHDADELYQDTMLVLWEKLDTLDEGRNIKSYALSTSIHIWNNRRRMRAWRQRILPQTSYELAVDEGSITYMPGADTLDPAAQIIRQDICDTVRAEAMRLPDKYRYVIYLYYSADMTVSEIADILHVSKNTVKTRLRRARNILKTRLEGKIDG